MRRCMLYFAFVLCFPVVTYADLVPAGVQVTTFALGLADSAGTPGGDLVTASSIVPGNAFSGQAFARAANGGMSLLATVATGVSPGGNLGEAQAFGEFEDALIFPGLTSGFVVWHGSGDGIITTSGGATAVGSVTFGASGPNGAIAAYQYSLTGGHQEWTTPMIPFQDLGALVLFMAGELDAQAIGPNASMATLDYSHTFDNFSISQYDTNGVLVNAFNINPSPEPATLALLGSGLAVLAALRRRRPRR